MSEVGYWCERASMEKCEIASPLLFTLMEWKSKWNEWGQPVGWWWLGAMWMRMVRETVDDDRKRQYEIKSLAKICSCCNGEGKKFLVWIAWWIVNVWACGIKIQERINCNDGKLIFALFQIHATMLFCFFFFSSLIAFSLSIYSNSLLIFFVNFDLCCSVQRELKFFFFFFHF